MIFWILLLSMLSEVVTRMVFLKTKSEQFVKGPKNLIVEKGEVYLRRKGGTVSYLRRKGDTLS